MCASSVRVLCLRSAFLSARVGGGVRTVCCWLCVAAPHNVSQPAACLTACLHGSAHYQAIRTLNSERGGWVCGGVLKRISQLGKCC